MSSDQVIATLWGEIERLREEARHFYLADGSYVVLDSAEEGIELRKKAAAKMQNLRAENAKLRDPSDEWIDDLLEVLNVEAIDYSRVDEGYGLPLNNPTQYAAFRAIVRRALASGEAPSHA